MPTELENIPDPYALGGMEPMQYIEKYVDSLGSSAEINIRREKYMAYKIQQLQMQHPDSKIAVVCGASHYKGILKFLETEQVIPLGFLGVKMQKYFIYTLTHRVLVWLRLDSSALLMKFGGVGVVVRLKKFSIVSLACTTKEHNRILLNQNQANQI